MSNQPPLNPDAHALRKAVEAVHNETCGAHGDLAHIAVNAYVHALAAAQPEVTTWQELDALPPESYVQGWDGFKHAKTHSGEWVLCVEHTRGAHNSESIELPARVLYRPNEGGHDGR